ncbi:MAG: GDSL-type esterase/lipase family protein [Acidimicrobiia bacterium]|nr:GDSL-type esterase/lipase family protein [Acidimicrobiia bacterium]
MNRFLALGDSYTVGEGVDPAEAWPGQLAAVLGLQSTVVASTGWTSRELLTALDAQPPVGPFELVSLSIGVNDQYRGLSRSEFADNAAALLDRATGWATRGVLIVSIPDWGVTPFAEGRDRALVAAEVDAFNADLAQLAGGRGVPFVDVTPLSRSSPAEVTGDGLHPSASQYQTWVQLIAPVVVAMLSGTVPA